MTDIIIKNLEKGKHLLQSISDEEYSFSQTPPYFSSIGSHTRHILDMFSCVFNGLVGGKIDFTERKRNIKIEQETEQGIAYYDFIIHKLKELNDINLNQNITVTDDLGNGKISAIYTLKAVLMQIHSHAIHHYATIGFIIHKLNIYWPDENFGQNPTTPKKTLTSK